MKARGGPAQARGGACAIEWLPCAGKRRGYWEGRGGYWGVGGTVKARGGDCAGKGWPTQVQWVAQVWSGLRLAG